MRDILPILLTLRLWTTQIGVTARPNYRHTSHQPGSPKLLNIKMEVHIKRELNFLSSSSSSSFSIAAGQKLGLITTYCRRNIVSDCKG